MKRAVLLMVAFFSFSGCAIRSEMVTRDDFARTIGKMQSQINVIKLDGEQRWKMHEQDHAALVADVVKLFSFLEKRINEVETEAILGYAQLKKDLNILLGALKRKGININMEKEAEGDLEKNLKKEKK